LVQDGKILSLTLHLYQFYKNHETIFTQKYSNFATVAKFFPALWPVLPYLCHIVPDYTSLLGNSLAGDQFVADEVET